MRVKKRGGGGIGFDGNHQPIRVQMFSYGDYEPFPPSARCHHTGLGPAGAAESGYNVIG